MPFSTQDATKLSCDLFIPLQISIKFIHYFKCERCFSDNLVIKDFHSISLLFCYDFVHILFSVDEPTNILEDEELQEFARELSAESLPNSNGCGMKVLKLNFYIFGTYMYR